MKIPPVSGGELTKILVKTCFHINNRVGSHITLIREGSLPLTVPMHKELKIGTLMTILKRADLPRIEFLDYYYKRKKPKH